MLSRRRFIETVGLGMTALAAPPLFARRGFAQSAGPIPGENVVVMIFLRGGADGLTHVIPRTGQFYGDYRNLRPSIGLPRTEDPEGGPYAPANDAPTAVFERQVLLPLVQRYRNVANQNAIDPGFFGINSTLNELLGLYTHNAPTHEGGLVAIHAVGNTSPRRSYSHFVAEDAIELAVDHPDDDPDGWMHRLIRELAPPGTVAPLTGVGIHPKPLMSLSGPETGLYSTIGSLERFGLRSDLGGDPRAILQNAFASFGKPPSTGSGRGPGHGILTTTGEGVFRALEDLTDLPAPGRYPAEGSPSFHADPVLNGRLSDAARLIKNPSLGVRAIAMDFVGNWDYHTNIVSETPSYTLRLAGALRDFYADLGTPDPAREELTNPRDRTVTLVVTEFGRTAYENGGDPNARDDRPGTDHGFGSVMYALGGKVIGNRVLSRRSRIANPSDANLHLCGWPGLAPDELNVLPGSSNPAPGYRPEQRDLAGTIDVRDVLADVLQHHMKLSEEQIARVLRGAQGSPYTRIPLPDDGLFES